MLLGQDLPAGGGINAPIFLGQPSRIPAVPLWVSIEGELIYGGFNRGVSRAHHDD